MSSAKVTVYVLQLNDRKQFYIGATIRRWEDRIMDIALGIDIPVFVRGKRFGVEETISNVTPLEELTTTLRYMKAYGPDRVRGACFSNMSLREDQIDTIESFMDIVATCETYLIGH
jgi:hypothetical protein